MKRLAATVCVLGFGLPVGGCGGSDASGAPARPQAVAVEWTKAMGSKDGETACSLMTPASVRFLEKPVKPLRVPVGPAVLRRGIPSRPCAALLSKGLAPRLPVRSTTVHKDFAVVRMDDSTQLLHRIVLLQVRGRWLIDFPRTWDHPFGRD
jgi:hypothetical protein